MVEVLRVKVDEDEGIEIFVDREEKRVWVKFPVSLHYFNPDGPLMTLASEVCGARASVPSDIAEKIGALAVCAPESSAKWRSELGIGAK
jgi:hypothetical protein